nr:H-NS histone family protein [Burkholderia sp. LS-044]
MARQAEIHDVVVKIREEVGKYMLEPRDIFPFLEEGRREVGRRRTVPKYMDPQTGATWSGRGRPPRWIANVENRDAFLLK